MVGFKIVDTKGVEMKSYTAGATITANDLVTLKTDGQVEPTTAGDVILGVAVTSASSGGTVYVFQGARLKVMGDSDEAGDAMASDMVGARVDITGATGAQQVDISTALQAGDGTDTGQLIVIEANPQGFGFDDDTSLAILEVVERQ